MKKINAIIVDDEPRGQNALLKLLEQNCPEIVVIATCSSADEAMQKIRELHPDLLFLDIAMPGKTGLDLLKEIGEADFEIIFVTAHNDYMVQAFQFSAVDYLLKPVEESLLTAGVKRAQKRIESKNGNKPLETFLHNMQEKGGAHKMKLCIPSLKGFRVIHIKDIIFCEANGNYTQFHLLGQPPVLVSKPIHEYDSLLEDSNFIRVHKSFLVNLEHIKEYIRGEGGSIILANGQEVEVSRRKKELLISRMKAFYKF
jgi:two-component system, LytTR family, response regulator